MRDGVDLAFTWLRGGRDFGVSLEFGSVAHLLPDFEEIGAGIYMGHYLVLSNLDGGFHPQYGPHTVLLWRVGVLPLPS